MSFNFVSSVSTRKRTRWTRACHVHACFREIDLGLCHIVLACIGGLGGDGEESPDERCYFTRYSSYLFVCVHALECG